MKPALILVGALVAGTVGTLFVINRGDGRPDFETWYARNDEPVKQVIRAGNSLLGQLSRLDKQAGGIPRFDTGYPTQNARDHLVGVNEIEIPVTNHWHSIPRQERLQLTQSALGLWERTLESQDAAEFAEPAIWMVDYNGNRVGGGTAENLSVQE